MNNNRNAIPKYVKIKTYFQELIEKGELKPGEMIPSTQELINKFGVGRLTIRQAIGELVLQGYLYTEQGKGTFVVDHNKKQASHLIGIIISDIAYTFFPEVIKALESTLSERGYSLILYNTDDDQGKLNKYIIELQKKNVDGMIIVPTDGLMQNFIAIKELQNTTIPFILIDRYLKEEQTDYVVFDYRKSGYLATDYLISLGHTIIGFIGSRTATDSQDRYEGYLKALSEKNLRFCLELIKDGKTEKDGYQVTKKLLKEKNIPTAILTIHDKLAEGVIRAIQEKGLIVPKDISVIGHDDLIFASHLNPPLTTIALPRYKMGIEAANLIVKKIKKQTSDQLSHIILQPKLVVRGSTASIS